MVFSVKFQKDSKDFKRIQKVGYIFIKLAIFPPPPQGNTHASNDDFVEKRLTLVYY